jgi:hypothetical protein
MAAYEIIAWRDIPAIVEARDAAGTVTRQLSDRWQALIDSVAMQVGLADSDAYLAEWTRSAPAERPGSAVEVAEGVAAELEEQFAEYAARAFGRP